MTVGAPVQNKWDSRISEEIPILKIYGRLSCYPTPQEPDHADPDNEHVAVIQRSPSRAASATDKELVKTLSSI